MKKHLQFLQFNDLILEAYTHNQVKLPNLPAPQIPLTILTIFTLLIYVGHTHTHGQPTASNSSYKSYNFNPPYKRRSHTHGLPTPSNSSYNSYNYPHHLRRSQTHGLPTPSNSSYNFYPHIRRSHTYALKFLLQILQF